MDPIDIVDLCRKASISGLPENVGIPFEFVRHPNEFLHTWTKDPKRVRQIIDETLCNKFSDVGLDLLLHCGALEALIPELCAIKNLGDADGLHKDVWMHTKKVVCGVTPSPDMRWSALLHDIGKATTRRVTNSGRVTFHNHDIVGAKMVENIQHRIGLFSNDQVLYTTVKKLVRMHLRPAGYHRTWEDSAIKRLLNDCETVEMFEKLMELSNADLTTKIETKRKKAQTKNQELKNRVVTVFQKINTHVPKLPKGTMGLILSQVGKSAGPWLNRLRFDLENHMKLGLIPEDMPIDFYVDVAIKRFVTEKYPD